MTEDKPPLITLERFAAFGSIINIFAALGMLVDGIIISMIGGNKELTGILLTSVAVKNQDKCEFVCAMFDASSLPDTFKKEGRQLINRVRSAAKLRNSIAHDTWIAGRRKNAIKPLSTTARGKLRSRGSNPGEKDWLASELLDESEKAVQLAQDLEAFMKKYGLHPYPANSSK
jgi:hypothetical protein